MNQASGNQTAWEAVTFCCWPFSFCRDSLGLFSHAGLHCVKTVFFKSPWRCYCVRFHEVAICCFNNAIKQSYLPHSWKYLSYAFPCLYSKAFLPTGFSIYAENKLILRHFLLWPKLHLRICHPWILWMYNVNFIILIYACFDLKSFLEHFITRYLPDMALATLAKCRSWSTVQNVMFLIIKGGKI